MILMRIAARPEDCSIIVRICLSDVDLEVLGGRRSGNTHAMVEIMIDHVVLQSSA